MASPIQSPSKPYKSIRLVCGDGSTVRLSRGYFGEMSLFRDPEIASSRSYTLRCKASPTIVNILLDWLEGDREHVEITKENVSELRTLCEELGFSGLDKELGAFDSRLGMKCKMGIIEERVDDHDLEIEEHGIDIRSLKEEVEKVKLLEERLAALERAQADLLSKHNSLLEDFRRQFGQKHYLQSSDNLYLSRDRSEGHVGQLVWDRESPNEWETWVIELVTPNVYAFKSLKDSCYITIEQDGTAVATSKTVTPEARFRIEEISSGNYIITGHNGNIFQPTPSHRVTCESTAVSPSSVVRIHPFFQIDGGLRSFFCPVHKTWISSEEESLNLVCDRPEPAQWETFTIEKYGDKFAFRTYHGRYVTLPKEAEVLEANATTVGPNELFKVKLKHVHDPREATVLIYAPNGKLLTPMKDGRSVEARVDKVGSWERIKIVVATTHK